jgi:hypothetical protein
MVVTVNICGLTKALQPTAATPVSWTIYEI